MRRKRPGRVWTADGDVLKNVLTGKVKKKTPLERPRTRRKATAKKDTTLVDWTSDREK